MRRPVAIISSLVFLLLAPGVVAGLVPWWISRWQMRLPLLGTSAVRLLGVVLIVAGVPMLLDSFARFAIQGLGTPAPVLPTKHLVVSGLYRYVRNPMYVGVVATVLGQGLLFGNVRLLSYDVVLWLTFHIFVRGYEEPKLRKTFGDEYVRFYAAVPRWIPRVSPWDGSSWGQ